MRGSRRMIFVSGMTLLAGCASWNVPTHVRMLRLSRVASAAVDINPLSWQFVEGQLVLRGSVEKRLKGPPTVAFLDAARVTLAQQGVAFSPQHLGRRIRPPHTRCGFAVPVPRLPDGTAKVGVRAPDEPHQRG